MILQQKEKVLRQTAKEVRVADIKSKKIFYICQISETPILQGLQCVGFLPIAL